MQSDELLYYVALNKIFCYKPKLSNLLIREFGSARSVFNLKKEELFDHFKKKYSFIDSLSDNRILEWAQKEINWATSKGVKITHFNEENYPSSLKECFDPPLLLYTFGNADFNQTKIVSIVGTRMSSRIGVDSCRKIISELTESGCSPIIISGLAYGVDVAAHRAALEFGLKTVAVLPNGLDRIYPAAHYEIAKKISKNGAIISEFPTNTKSLKINFIQRNRLIAALSKATIVIESREKGGALSTAELAQSYSREVFALPGRMSDTLSCGCNNLIYNNIATLYKSTASFLLQMGWDSDNERGKTKQGELFFTGSPVKEKILVALSSHSELEIDELLHISEENIQALFHALIELELDGKILSLSGNRYCLA